MPVFQLSLLGWKGCYWKEINDWTAVRQLSEGFCNAKLKRKCWQSFAWIGLYQNTSNKICLTFSFKLWLCLAWQGISEIFLSADLYITETVLLQFLKCCSQFWTFSDLNSVTVLQNHSEPNGHNMFCRHTKYPEERVNGNEHNKAFRGERDAVYILS